MAIVYIVDSNDDFTKLQLTEALLAKDSVILVPEGSQSFHMRTLIMDSFSYLEDAYIEHYTKLGSKLKEILMDDFSIEPIIEKNPYLSIAKPIPYKSKIKLIKQSSNIRHTMRSVNRNR